jgi:hypothetical protein
VAVQSRHQAFQGGSDDLPGLLGITVGQQLHERLQMVVVRTERELDDAGGQPASPLEHGRRVVENFLEGAGRPSTAHARAKGAQHRST